MTRSLDVLLNRIFQVRSPFLGVFRLLKKKKHNKSWKNISVVIIPVIKKDINALKISINSLIKIQNYIGEIHLIIRSNEIEFFQDFRNEQVKLICEENILNSEEQKLRGWLKQQLIKIKHASDLVQYSFVMWMDSDLTWINRESIFDDRNNPILRYSDENHILYKNGLIQLGFKPSWTRSFIPHYMVVEPVLCKDLLLVISKNEDYAREITKIAESNYDMFSEYDLYAAIYLRSRQNVTMMYWNVKNSRSDLLLEHEKNSRKYAKFGYTAIAYHNYDG